MEQLIILHSDISIEEASAVLPFISESFLISMITDAWPERTGDFYTVNFRVPADLYEEWIEHNHKKRVYLCFPLSKSSNLLTKHLNRGM